MIVQTFYALVLFPYIKYNKVLKEGFKLKKILEKSIGEFEVIFKKAQTNKEYKIYFTHKDTIKNKKKKYINKEWEIKGKNKKLKNIIIKLIKPNKDKDFNFFKPNSYYKKIPFGVVFTISHKCNLGCYYCFNDYDYNLLERNNKKDLKLKEIKKIIDKLYKAGTREIIISGGEPLLHPQIFEIISYLKKKGMYCHINTNGTLLKSSIDRLNKTYPINLMVSLHEFSKKEFYKVQTKTNNQNQKYEKGFNALFINKIKTLQNIKKYENISLDILTILKNKNIKNLETIYKFVLNKMQIENWHFFRLYPTSNNEGISRGMLGLAIKKIHKLNKKYNKNFKIVDATPFCIIKNLKISSLVIEGELEDDHNVKTIITPTGGIQIMSAFDTTLGNILKDNIKNIWKSDFIQKMLNNDFLPEECIDCKLKDKCKGGSRFVSHVSGGSYKDLDPLANLKNKKNVKLKNHKSL